MFMAIYMLEKALRFKRLLKLYEESIMSSSAFWDQHASGHFCIFSYCSIMWKSKYLQLQKEKQFEFFISFEFYISLIPVTVACAY